MKPLAIDLFCGLGGWAEGLMSEGWHVIGFDIEQHVYGEHRYPATLVIQDVLTLHGSQFRNADLIVASPPCQEYSYMAMPWSRAKKIAAEYRAGVRDVKKLTALFDACFRIQREACEAAGRHIPMIVENVRGAQKWVGRARWNYGSFYLWGDVPALMPPERKFKSSAMNWSDQSKRGQDFTRMAGMQALNEAGLKYQADCSPRMWRDREVQRVNDGIKGVPHRPSGHWTNPAEHEGIKQGGDRFSDGISLTTGSKSPARKFASAMIAKIPLQLSRYIGRALFPKPERSAA